MASTQSIAERRANAITRLNDGFRRLADVTGVQAPVIAVLKKERDPLFAQAKMLETLADWMDAHVGSIAPDLDEAQEAETVGQTIDVPADVLDNAMSTVDGDNLSPTDATAEPDAEPPAISSLFTAEALESLTRSQLDDMAVERGIDPSKAKNKGEVVAMLLGTSAQ